MSFKKLKSILSPPNFAISLDDSPKWSEVENKLGIVLPSDYKEFITLYGSGTIGNFIMIYSPFTENENMNLFIQQKLNKDAYLTLKVSYPEDFPYDVYPTNGGMLTWGRTENGDTLNWIVDTNQGDWAILIDDGSGDYFEYKGSMTGFLYDVLSGSIRLFIYFTFCHLHFDPKELLRPPPTNTALHEIKAQTYANQSNTRVKQMKNPKKNSLTSFVNSTNITTFSAYHNGESVFFN